MSGYVELKVRIEIGSDEFWEEILKGGGVNVEPLLYEVTSLLEDHGHEVEVRVASIHLAE